MTGVQTCALPISVGPQYHAPAVDAPPHFANASLPPFTEAPVKSQFWALFADPQLTQLESEALDANKDLLIAMANLQESRAARRLNVVQPALSRALKELEAELGMELLDRTRRSVQLTTAGRVLLDETALMFERF